MLSDADQMQLLEDLRKGGRTREAAISALYKSLFPPLMAHLKIQGCAHHKAEDCVQEAFIKVLRNLEHFRGDAKLSTWIRTILDNTWRDSLRSTYDSRGTDLDSAGVDTMESDDSQNAPQLLDREELSDCVRLGYQQYQQKHQKCSGWLYRLMEGASVNELAEEAGRSPGAMREFLSQCRKKLAPFIEHCRPLLLP
jgi:RNA polymerase sigma factor (sigma-70 family)